MEWKIGIGELKISVQTAGILDPVEAATRAVEMLISKKTNFKIGLLVSAENDDDFSGYLRADVILANAGLYDSATAMTTEINKYLEKNKPKWLRIAVINFPAISK